MVLFHVKDTHTQIKMQYVLKTQPENVFARQALPEAISAKIIFSHIERFLRLWLNSLKE